jgi:hypothetical protein
MWSNALRVLIASTMAPLAFAAPAAAEADSAEYLHAVAPVYTNFTPEQLLSEGFRVCKGIGSGMKAPDAVQMVQKDIGASVPAAGDIVSAAVMFLDC